MFPLAQLISFVSNPIFLAFPMPFLLVYRETTDSLYAFKWMLFSTLYIVIVGMFVLYEVRRQVFVDIDVSKREQRPLLFLFVGFVSLLYFGSVFLLDGPTILYIASGGILGSIVILTLVNKRIKASIHVATISAFLCMLALLYGGLHVLWILLIPLVAWSRVKTKRHTINEVIIGALLGVVLTLGVYTLFKIIEQIV